MVAEQRYQQLATGGLVVDDQNTGHRHSLSAAKACQTAAEGAEGPFRLLIRVSQLPLREAVRATFARTHWRHAVARRPDSEEIRPALADSDLQLAQSAAQCDCADRPSP